MNHLRVLLLAALLLCSAACGSDTQSQDLVKARDAYSQGFYLESETGYERYLQLNPQGTHRKEAWERLLEISLNIKGDMHRAVSLLEAMSLELGGNKREAWQVMYRLGGIYNQMGKRQKAVEALEKSLMLAEGFPDAIVKTQLKLARIYRAQGNYDLVMEALQNCASNADTQDAKAQCFFELAQSYSLINNWTQVRTSLNELLKLENVDSEMRAMAIFLLAESYDYDHDYDKARELLKSILKTYPNPKVVEARLKALADEKSD